MSYKISLIKAMGFLSRGLTLIQLNYFCGFTIGWAYYRGRAYGILFTFDWTNFNLISLHFMTNTGFQLSFETLFSHIVLDLLIFLLILMRTWFKRYIHISYVIAGLNYKCQNSSNLATRCCRVALVSFEIKNVFYTTS